MKIVICDADKKYNKILSELLYQIALEIGYNIKIKSFVSSEECIDYVRTDNIDLVILNTYIDKMNGIELARRLRKVQGKTFHLLYVSDVNTFAAETYEVQACGFLLKPVDKEKLMLLIKKLGRP